MTERNRRTAELLRMRRVQLRLAQNDLRARGGPSPDTVVKFETGRIAENPQFRTLAAFDTSLDWEPGSTRAVLDGGSPVPIDRYSKVQLTGPESIQPHVVSHAEEWVAVPRTMIQELALASNRLIGELASAQMDSETAERVSQLTASLAALTATSEQVTRAIAR